MPLYDYVCPFGHRTELIRPQTIMAVICPTCRTAATRGTVHRFAVTSPEADTRGMFRRYQEATHEIDYHAGQIEASVGHAIPTPNYWAAAKARGKEMVKAGEPFRPLDS